MFVTHILIWFICRSDGKVHQVRNVALNWPYLNLLEKKLTPYFKFREIFSLHIKYHVSLILFFSLAFIVLYSKLMNFFQGSTACYSPFAKSKWKMSICTTAGIPQCWWLFANAIGRRQRYRSCCCYEWRWNTYCCCMLNWEPAEWWFLVSHFMNFTLYTLSYTHAHTHARRRYCGEFINDLWQDATNQMFGWMNEWMNEEKKSTKTRQLNGPDATLNYAKMVIKVVCP